MLFLSIILFLVLGTYLPTVVFEHVPMVQRENESGIYHGIEVEIIKALGSAMNFKPSFYESNDSKTEQRGKFLPNGSYTGLIGQIVHRVVQLVNTMLLFIIFRSIGKRCWLLETFSSILFILQLWTWVNSITLSVLHFLQLNHLKTILGKL